MNVTATTQNAATPAATPSAKAEGGKSLPPAGKAAPVADHPVPAPTIDKALEQIKSFLKDSQRQLAFQRDEATGRTIIRVMDASGQVIRQMPSEEILKLAAMIDSNGFHILNELA